MNATYLHMVEAQIFMENDQINKIHKSTKSGQQNTHWFGMTLCGRLGHSCVQWNCPSWLPYSQNSSEDN